MAAGDPYPTGEVLTVRVPPSLAADFVTTWMSSGMNKRPVLRMVLRAPENGEESDLGGWQIIGVASARRDAGYDVVTATMRAVFD